MPSPILLLWPFVLGQTLLVTSALDCPTAAAVDSRVRETLGLTASVVFEEHASIERDGTSLRVTLRSHDDRVLGDRRLDAQGSCTELAGIVAVVLSTWLSDVHPEYVGSLPDAPRPPNVPRESIPIPPPPIEAKVAPRRFVIGAAVGADLSAEKPVPLGTVGTRWMSESGLGISAAATIIAPRTQELGSGSVRHWRWPLLLGPAYRFPAAPVAFDLEAGAALAWLHVAGEGFSSPSTHDDFHAGGFASVRVASTGGKLQTFAEMTGVVWRPTQAFVQRGADEISVDLPRFELQLALGAALSVW